MVMSSVDLHRGSEVQTSIFFCTIRNIILEWYNPDYPGIDEPAEFCDRSS